MYEIRSGSIVLFKKGDKGPYRSKVTEKPLTFPRYESMESKYYVFYYGDYTLKVPPSFVLTPQPKAVGRAERER